MKYQNLDQYKLISEYSTTKPLIEHTTGEALVIPVIENVDMIYTIDKSNAFEVDEAAETTDTEDKYVTINGKKYNKTDVIAQLKAITGSKIAANIGDDKLIAKVNELSDEDEETLFANLTAVE